MAKACLRNASLEGALFAIADLSGADINHADFLEAVLDGTIMAQLLGAPQAEIS